MATREVPDVVASSALPVQHPEPSISVDFRRKLRLLAGDTGVPAVRPRRSGIRKRAAMCACQCRRSVERPLRPIRASRFSGGAEGGIADAAPAASQYLCAVADMKHILKVWLISP